MSKIRVLSDQLANQIAAGEVVERPASVVKEIIENSIDAGANRIQVEIEGGGTRLIRVIDNGEGMDSDDLLLCLERHGTSKIKDAADLAAIDTLGFRGEAIPSIASVSIFSMISRTKLGDLGHKIEVKFGKLVASHEVGCQIGTTVEIKNLFGNTPARRKFLKTARTELNHIDDVIKNYSLVCPEITFILKVDGRETINLNASLSLSERISKILRTSEKFMVVDHKNNNHRATGLLLPPESVRPGPAKLRVFVNGRAVKDRSIYHAIVEGMRGFLMKGHNPVGLLALDIPPSEVDVNVHPAKHEIRFKSAREIHQLVNIAVKNSLVEQQKILRDSIFIDNGPRPTDSMVENTFIDGNNKHLDKIDEKAMKTFDMSIGEKSYQPQSIYQDNKNPHTDFNEENPSIDFVVPKEMSFNPRKVDQPKADAISEFREPAPTFKEDSNTKIEKVTSKPTPVNETQDHGLNYMGQVANLFLFCQTPDGIVVIDQHAAHERLLFEKLKNNFTNNNMVKQNLLFPETVELSIYQSQLVEKHLEDLERMGFSLRDFGGNHYVISAIPALAGQIAPQTIFFDTLEQFGNDGSSQMKGDILDTVLATMACRAAVKGGTNLSPREVDILLKDMANANLFSHCPHGRPVVKQFSSDEIKKWFHRP